MGVLIMSKAQQPAVFTEGEKLIDKANQVRQKMADSLERAKAEKITLQEQITELEKHEKDCYSMFVMDEISSSAYEEAKAETKAKRNQLANIQSKINDMDELKRYEMGKVYSDYGKIQKEFLSEKEKHYSNTKKQLEEAKEQFKQQVAEISKKEYEVHSLYSKIMDIGVDAGRERKNYSEYYSPYIRFYGLTRGDSLNIGNTELDDVYTSRNKDARGL